MTEENFAWFAGIDWGSERHQACLVDAQGRIVGEREFPHGGKGLADLCDWLLSMCGAAETVAVGKPSMKSNTALLASAGVLNRLRASNSHSSVAKKLSHIALS